MFKILPLNEILKFEYKMNNSTIIKSIFKGVFILLGISLCSCSSDDDNSDSVTKPIKLTLKSSKTEIIPFEYIKVSIEQDLESLSNNYDSITWRANGTAYSGFLWDTEFRDDEERDIRLSDYRLGKHKAYVQGYKDGSIISIDSIEYTVNKSNNDFIRINWKESENNQYFHYTTGHSPINYMSTDTWNYHIGGVSINFYHIVDVDKNKKEYVKMDIVPWAFLSSVSPRMANTVPDINDFDWHDESEQGNIARYQMEYDFFHNYLTELFGASKFIYEGDDITKNTLEDEFSGRFTYRYSNDFYPVEIWETPSTYICLMQANNNRGTYNQRGICCVVAQPRK